MQNVSGNIKAFTVHNSSTRLTSVIHNNNNTVLSESYNNNTIGGTLSTGTLNLFYTFSNNTPDKTVSGNTTTSITKTWGALNGYYASSSYVISGTETTTGFNPVYGILTGNINGTLTNLNIYNNYIYDLKAPGSKASSWSPLRKRILFSSEVLFRFFLNSVSTELLVNA